MMSKRSPSDFAESTVGSVQSFSVRLMSLARSVLPLPVAPWHISQSNPYIFLALACESAVAFTGFLTVDDGAAGAAGAGAGSCGTGPGFAAGAASNNITEERSSKNFNIPASSVAGVEFRHLAADRFFQAEL